MLEGMEAPLRPSVFTCTLARQGRSYLIAATDTQEAWSILSNHLRLRYNIDLSEHAIIMPVDVQHPVTEVPLSF